MNEEEYYRLRRRSLDRGVCQICGYIPKLKLSDYKGWRISVKKQAMGAHFRKHWKEVA